MTLQSKSLLRDIAFEIRKVTLLRIQGPDEPSAKNIRACLNNGLIAKLKVSTDSLIRAFTTALDFAALMARVAKVSVSR